MKEQLKQFIRDQAFLGLALVERLPQLHAEYEEARCASKAVGHTCSICFNYFDVLNGIKAESARMTTAKALLALL